MDVIDYADLLSQDFDHLGGRDCVWLASVVLERAGFALPPGALPASYEDQEAAMSQDFLGHWDRIEKPERIGDVVYSAGEDGRHHVSVVVGTEPLRVITTSRKYGVQCYPLSRLNIPLVLGYYRLRDD